MTRRKKDQDPEVIIVIERPGKDVYILMIELKIKIYRIISK